MSSLLRSLERLSPALLALVVAACTWPFWTTLGHWPMTADPPVWIGRGALFTPGWQQWIFESDHFSWYRPVAALSFTLNQAVVGFAPMGYRLVDLGLHVGAGLLTYALVRAIAPKESRLYGVLAAFLFLAHAGSDEVVPFIARRSYSLALVFGLGALVVLARALREREAGGPSRSLALPSLATSLLLPAALLSNEGAIVIVGLMPLLALHLAAARRIPHTRWLAASILPLVTTVGALAWRHHVLGGSGGYTHETAGDQTSLEIFTEAARHLTGAKVLGRVFEGGLGDTIGFVLLAAAGLLLARALLLSLARLSDARERSLGLFALATLVYLALFATSRIWFPRQIYFVQATLALTLPFVIAAARSRSGPLPLASQLLAFLVTFAIAASSPLVHGQIEWRRDNWANRQKLLDHMVAGLAELEGPAQVYVVLPNVRPKAQFSKMGGTQAQPRSVRQPIDWSTLVYHDRELTLTDLAYTPLDAPPNALTLTRGPAGALRLEIAPGQEYLMRTSRGFSVQGPSTDRSIPLRSLPESAGTSDVRVRLRAGGELVGVVADRPVVARTLLPDPRTRPQHGPRRNREEPDGSQEAPGQDHRAPGRGARFSSRAVLSERLLRRTRACSSEHSARAERGQGWGRGRSRDRLRAQDSEARSSLPEGRRRRPLGGCREDQGPSPRPRTPRSLSLRFSSQDAPRQRPRYPRRRTRAAPSGRRPLPLGGFRVRADRPQPISSRRSRDHPRRW